MLDHIAHANATSHAPMLSVSAHRSRFDTNDADRIGHVTDTIDIREQRLFRSLDLRTPLHLAASEGHVDVVQYLTDQLVDPAPRDRWGGTPLDDALRHGHGDVAELLRARLTNDFSNSQ